MSRLLPVVSAVALLLAACGTPSSGTPAGAVAAAYPLAWLVTEIAPDMEVTSLATGGQDPHDLELTPRQRATIETAGLVVYLGDIGFQPQVEAAIPEAQGQVVDASKVLGDAMQPISDGHGDAHGDDDDHESAVDPHFWFDAALMARVATAIGNAAATANPSAAETYRANADDVASQLDDLAGEITALLSDCTHRTVVVSHEAYQYLLEPAGLEQHGVSSAAGHSGASPQGIAQLADEIRDNNLPAVLTEPVEGRTDAEAVAAEAGVDLIEIYSLDVVDDEQAAKGFPALLREQAAAVAEAAACGT